MCGKNSFGYFLHCFVVEIWFQIEALHYYIARVFDIVKFDSQLTFKTYYKAH